MSYSDVCQGGFKSFRREPDKALMGVIKMTFSNLQCARRAMDGFVASKFQCFVVWQGIGRKRLFRTLHLSLAAAATTVLIGCNTPELITQQGADNYVVQDHNPPVTPVVAPKTKLGRIIFGDHVSEIISSSDVQRPFRINRESSEFCSSDEFAYIVELDEPFGTSRPEFVWSTVSDSGSERVVYREFWDVADPDHHSNSFDQYDRCEELLGGMPYGKYRVRCLRNDKVIAQGEFTYCEEGGC